MQSAALTCAAVEFLPAWLRVTAGPRAGRLVNNRIYAGPNALNMSLVTSLLYAAKKIAEFFWRFIAETEPRNRARAQVSF